MKKLINWQLITILGLALAISLLYSVLQADYLALPDSGLSRGIELERYETGQADAFETKSYAVIPSDTNFYILSPSEKGLKLTIKSLEFKNISTHYFDHFTGLADLACKKNGDYLVVSRYLKESHKLELISIDLSNQKAQLEASYTLDKVRQFTLVPTGIYYSDDHTLYFQGLNGKRRLAVANFNESIALASNDVPNQQLLAYTNFVDGTYQIDLLTLNDENAVITYKPNYLTISAGGAVKPSEMAVSLNHHQVQLLSVLKDNKSGMSIASWYHGSLDKLDSNVVKQFNSFTYALNPLFYWDEQQRIHLIVTAKTSIGKVEIGTDGKFQNLIDTDPNLEKIQSLTRSTKLSFSPTYLFMNKVPYLFYIQVDHGKAQLMGASSADALVRLSQKISLSERFSLFMTTLTTFMPLMYVALIIEVYILTPVLIVIVFISMFKLTWAERHAKEMFLIALLLHVFTKFYFVWQHVIINQTLTASLPTFLNSPAKFIAWALLMNAIALLALWRFYEEKTKQHYMTYYICFNLIDVTFFTMFYAPYYLLQ